MDIDQLLTGLTDAARLAAALTALVQALRAARSDRRPRSAGRETEAGHETADNRQG
ncbi:hypothetical protein [Kitasatospora sp. NPDC004272]